MAGEIARGLDVAEARALKDFSGGRGLTRRELDRKDAAFCEVRGRIRDDAPHKREAIGPSLESETRLEIADIGLQRRDLSVGDVGRVGGDDVELPTAPRG